MKSRQLLTLLGLLFLGGILFFIPHTENIPETGWRVFVIFFLTIVAIILKPLPMGPVAILAMSIATITKTLPLEEMLVGFSNDIVWLVLLAFFIALGFIKTGLGTRIGYYFIAFLGKKTMGLGYGLLSCDFILSPAVPSMTARSGGVVFPIAEGLSKSFGSTPEHKTEKKIGAYLMKVAFQGSTVTSAMFLTAMAANPFLVCLTQSAGYTVTWGTWALAALVPGIISLILYPIIIYKLYPPGIKDTPDAPALARQKLKEMGKIKREEQFMLIVFVLLLILWIGGEAFGIKATVSALVGLSLLLIFNVLSWKDVLSEDKAWDTFVWFATLITLASALNKHGFTPWFSEQIVHSVGGLHWGFAFVILYLIYYYSHYLFASCTAHVGAMYPAFLMVAIGLGTPPMVAIFSFAFASNLFGGLTHYGSGPAPLYYGSGYIDLKSFWKTGFILSLFNIVVWLGLGSLWWKLIGLW